MKLVYRDHVVPSDRDSVRHIVVDTGFFNDEEVLIAVELVDAHLAHGRESGYHFLFCEKENHDVVGYTCYGPVTGTRSSFDLYWIAVDPSYQGKGIGRDLIIKTEEAISSLGGSRIYIETSSKDLYKPTQAFYFRAGYINEALLKDFYAPGDGKIIYSKALKQ